MLLIRALDEKAGRSRERRTATEARLERDLRRRLFGRSSMTTIRLA